MTTIAFDGKFLAADRQVGRNDRICQKGIKKIIRLKNDFVVGLSGSYCSQFQIFKDWVESGMKGNQVLPKTDTSTYIAITPKGKIYEFTNTWQAPMIEDHIFAWGSGSHFAFGALYAGVNAATAVKIASKLDPWTGGKIDVIQIR